MAEKELVEALRRMANTWLAEEYKVCAEAVRFQVREAADAIAELSARVDRLQAFADNISKLPDCNTCLKKNLCEFMPKYGEYCRINCPAWLGAPEQPKGEKK